MLTVARMAMADSFLQGGFQTAGGQDTGIFADSPTREKIDLSGPWNVSIGGREPIIVEVPGSYAGTGELVYERTFELSDDHLQNTSLHLIAYGINYFSEIYVNGTLIGSHSGGATSFVVPVRRDILIRGENTIRVAVSNSLRVKETLPIRAQIWTPMNYGGIYRDIYLLVSPEVSILDEHIETTFLDGYSVAEVDVHVSVGRHEIAPADIEAGGVDTASYGLMVEILDRMRGSVLAQSQRTQLSLENVQLIEQTVRVVARNPRLWSPEQPDLYTVSIVLFRNGEEYDRKNVIYGFREVTIRDGNIYVNGERFRARGILYHEYHPDTGSALSYEMLERDVALMKIANVNLVRVGYFPPHPYLLNLFDRYGMFCMIEIPAVNIPGSILKSQTFRSTAQSYLEHTILRDRHHPSVFAWGFGDNLEMPHAGAAEYVRMMRELAQELDQRPVYAGSQFPSNDIATRYLDLAVLNIPPGMTKGIAESVAAWRERFNDKPLIIGKLGYYVKPGSTTGFSDPHSYDAQARYLMHQMQALREIGVDGIVVNSFSDWRAQRPSMVALTDDLSLHSSGVVCAERRQRRGFETIRALYRGEKLPPLSAGETPGGTPFEYIAGGFLVLIGFAYLLNTSRRFRENVNRSLLRPYNFFADVRDQRILSGFHTVYLGLIISLTMGMIFSSFLQHYRTNQIVDYTFTHLLMSDSLMRILASAVVETWQIALILTALCFFSLVLIGVLIRLGSIFVKSRVLLTHSFIISFWSALPLVLFIPLSMILYNVLETEAYVAPILGLIGLLAVWVLFRLLKAVSIIYDVVPYRVYALGILGIVIVNAIMLLVGEYTQATYSYISFFIHMFEGFRF